METKVIARRLIGYSETGEAILDVVEEMTSGAIVGKLKTYIYCHAKVGGASKVVSVYTSYDDVMRDFRGETDRVR